MSVLSDRDARSKLSDSNKGRCVDVFWVRSHFRSVLARKSNAGFPVVNPAYGYHTRTGYRLILLAMYLLHNVPLQRRQVIWKLAQVAFVRPLQGAGYADISAHRQFTNLVGIF